jgi:hypothetical protein
MDKDNPFALIRASEYSDAQINSLWVELGSKVINEVIDPRLRQSKYILGGKGSGKTHLLRYHSYQVARLRFPEESGLSTVTKHKFVAIFLRASQLDSARIEINAAEPKKWQQLFGIYLELKLAEGVVDILKDIKNTSPTATFDDSAFLSEISKTIPNPAIMQCQSIDDFQNWILTEKRKIDIAVNNWAFSGKLEVEIPFSIGSLCLPINQAMAEWNSSLKEIPLIYLLDEIENFSFHQQQVVNTFIRYGEGRATFRITGRLYARKTTSTLSDGEENREGAEFATTNLDDILRRYSGYAGFARKFVSKRLIEAGLLLDDKSRSLKSFSPSSFFEDIDTENFYQSQIAKLKIVEDSISNKFQNALTANTDKKFETGKEAESRKIVGVLCDSLPLMLQKLNLLLFCKKFNRKENPIELATMIKDAALNFYNNRSTNKSFYANAYGHYAADLFAQLCRESRGNADVPYAGFDTFVTMSSGNPRNLLNILGKIYSIALFRGLDFINGHRLSVEIQTIAASEAARFMYEADTNYGMPSEQAKEATTRLANLLRTARYSLNIPEVAPLAVSFSESDLSPSSKIILERALNYSFVFEVYDGRPDRNSHRLNKKIQLNPLLSPKWGLPIGRRGDINLNKDLLNAIFDPALAEEFRTLLKSLEAKWNNPFKRSSQQKEQKELF